MTATKDQCGVEKAGKVCKHAESVHLPTIGGVPAHCTKCKRGPIQVHRYPEKAVTA
jgi:hypothetical protein